MSELHPTPAAPADNTTAAPPAKPRPDFPLHAHASGQWARKIRGRRYCFGVWADPDAAEKRYREQAEALHAGRKPRESPEGATVKDACNAFLYAKQSLVDAGESSPRTWDGSKGACDFQVERLGKSRLMADLGPDDFAALRNRLAKRYGPHGLGTAVQCIRSISANTPSTTA
jgi:hypothetical protein